MKLHQGIALVVLPLTIYCLYVSWLNTLRLNSMRLERGTPPPILFNAHAQLQNRLEQLRITAQGALTRQRYGEMGIMASAFRSITDPGGLLFSAPGSAVDWSRMTAETRIQLQTYSNEVQRLWLEYKMTTRNSLPLGFPRREVR